MTAAQKFEIGTLVFDRNSFNHDAVRIVSDYDADNWVEVERLSDSERYIVAAECLTMKIRTYA